MNMMMDTFVANDDIWKKLRDLIEPPEVQNGFILVESSKNGRQK
jgi:hypothetical protein